MLINWKCLVVSWRRLIFQWRAIFFNIFKFLPLVVCDWVIPFTKFWAKLISPCKLCWLEYRIPQVSCVSLLLRHAKIFDIYSSKNFQKIWILQICLSSVIIIVLSNNNHRGLKSKDGIVIRLLWRINLLFCLSHVLWC